MTKIIGNLTDSSSICTSFFGIWLFPTVSLSTLFGTLARIFESGQQIFSKIRSDSPIYEFATEKLLVVNLELSPRISED